MNKKREVKKFYAFGKQTLISLCGVEPIYSIQLMPYKGFLFETFNEAEKGLMEMLETTENEAYRFIWIIVPVYFTGR